MDDLIIIVIMVIAGIVSLIRKSVEEETKKKKAHQDTKNRVAGETAVEPGFRRCSKCGTVNLEEAVNCFGCGSRFSQHVEQRKKKSIPFSEAVSRIEQESRKNRQPREEQITRPAEDTAVQEIFLETESGEDYPESLSDRLSDSEALRETVILKEILDPPKALRRSR